MNDFQRHEQACKENYVVAVKQIVSTACLDARDAIHQNTELSTDILLASHNDVDKAAVCVIIALTVVELTICGGHYAELEDSDPQDTRNTQSSPGACQRRAICHKRLFRPKRSRAGQIRDASPGACRRHAAGKGGKKQVTK